MTRAMILSIVLLAGCGSNIPLPPTQYDHEPTRPFTDYRVPYFQVASACRTFGPHLNGCVVPGRIPLRIMATGLNAQDEAALTRHENGHLNGWPADHPGAHF